MKPVVTAAANRLLIAAAIACAVFGSRPAGSAVRLTRVPDAYVAIATEYGVPAGLLYAIGMVESNASFSGRPWPWTLNVRGTPHRFASKREAADYLTALLAKGEDMVDVGLMQVNWHWHGEKLVSPEVGLSPYYNLRVGAAYLSDLYRESGNWAVAIARYHSPDAVRGAQYARQVVAHWERVDS